MTKTRTVRPEGNLHGLGNVRSLDDLQAWVDAIVDQIPDEYRAATSVSIYESDDGGLSSMYVSYERPETPEDVVNDERSRREWESRQNAEEFERYQALKQKFEKSS